MESARCILVKFCDKCGQKLNDEDLFCYKCGAKSEGELEGAEKVGQEVVDEVVGPKEPDKKSSKNGCMVMLLVVLGLGVVLLFGSCMGEKNSSKPNSTPAKSSQVEQPKTPTLDYSCDVESIGNVKGTTINKVGFAIAEIRETKDISSAINTTSAQGIFKLVFVVITNNQNNPIEIVSSSFKLLDDKGRVFEYSSDAKFALKMKQQEVLGRQKINPGNTYGAYIAFDVPEDTKIRGLQVDGKELPFRVIK